MLMLNEHLQFSDESVVIKSDASERGLSDRKKSVSTLIDI